MTSETTKFELTRELIHSHSDMTRQLDELEAHAQALRCAEGDLQEIFEDLLIYTRQFGAELLAHINEEETNAFPAYRQRHGAKAQSMLHRIYEQHRDLEHSFSMLISFLEAAEDLEDPIDSDLIESIYIRARLLRYAFIVHSTDEEEFFQAMARLDGR